MNATNLADRSRKILKNMDNYQAVVQSTNNNQSSQPAQSSVSIPSPSAVIGNVMSDAGNQSANYSPTRNVSAASDNWYSGAEPTYAEYVARVYSKKDSLTPDEFNNYIARIDALKSDPKWEHYNPYKQGATSKDVAGLAALGIDVSNIDDKWIEANKHLLDGAYYTDVGTKPAKGKTPSQNAAYYYSNIVDQYESTKTIQNLAEELKQEVMFKASLTDKNYSDQQILDSIDWNGKYKWLNNLDTEYAKGHIYEYTAPIDFDRDELAGYMWAGRNDGGTGNSTKDAVMAALGQGNVWQENAELAAELNPASGENYKPYKHGGTAEDVLQYFGATSLPAGWVEKAEKTINWNDDQAVKMLQAGKKAEDFTVQAEKEAAEIKNRIAAMPVTATTDIDEAMEVLYSKWGTNSPALSTLQKLDDPQYSKTLQQTTRSIDYSRADVKAALQEKIDKEKWKETLPEFAQTVKQITTATNIVHGDNAPITSVSGAASGVNTPALPVNQSALAVNDAKTKIVQSSIKTILGAGTEDEKRLFTLAPVVNSEAMAAEIGNSIQTGTATAGDLYETASKQAQDFVTANYLFAKGAIEYYDGLNAELADLEKNQAALVKQREELASRDTSAVQDEEIPATGDWDWQLAMINDQIARDSAKQAELDALDMQISLGEEAIARKQGEIKDYQWRYDEAKDDLAATQSMIGAVAMQSVWRTNPDADFTTPEGQKMLAEAVAKESGLVNAIDHVMSVGREYKPTVWSPSTVFQAMTENGATKDEAQAMARSIAAESDKAASTLNQEIAQMQSAGVDMPAAWKNNLDREKALQERNAQEAKDYLLQAEPGFEEAAKKGTEAVKADKKHEYSDLSHAILDPENAHTTVQAAGLVAEMNDVKFVNAMTQDEKDTYAAKLHNEGEAEAVRYFERLTDSSYGVLQTRVSEKIQEASKDFAEKYPALALGTSAISNPLTITGAGYALYSLLAGKEINPYNEWYHSNIAVGTMDSASKKAILDSTGLEEGNGLRTLLGWGLNGVTEAIKSGENALLMGPLVSGIDNPIFREVVAASSMALQSGGSTARDVKIRKGSNAQAAILAGIDFAANVATEAMTYGNMEEAFGKGASKVKAAAKKSILENPFIEEPIGEVLSDTISYVSDDLVMGALSNRQQQIAEYENTMSHSKAVKKADQDFMKGLIETAITTALSTGASQGASYVAGRLTANNAPKTPSTEGQIRAIALENKGATSRTLTMLCTSLNANQSSQVQAVSAALFPVNGSTESQNAAISAGLHMSARFGSEQAVSVVTDVLLNTMYEGADIDTVKGAVSVAALGKGEAFAVLEKIGAKGVEYGDISALVEAAARDTQNSNIQNIIEATVKNDRILARERDLIGDGALNAVRPYEQAYNRATEAVKKAQAALEAEQERAKVMGENLKTVQAQHVEAPDNQAVRGAMQQAAKDVVGQTKVVDEYQQALERQQQEVKQAEKDLEQVRQENMTKVREQAIADVEAQVQAEAEARAKAEQEIKDRYKNVHGEIGVMNGRPTLKTDSYVILPDPAGGFFVKFNQPNEEAAQRLQALGMEYDDLMEAWYGGDDLVKIQDTIDNVSSQNVESEIDDIGQQLRETIPEATRQGVQRTEAPKDNISFRKGTSGQTMPQSQNSTSGEVVSGHDIVKRLTDALGITNDTRIKKYLRAARKNTLGYTRNNGVTHTRYIQDAQTAIHEIGHNLDVRLGLQRMVPDMAQLESNYSQQIDSRFKMKYTAQERPGELMADFARVWALDRDAAVALAGDKFVEKYERALKDHGWLEAMQTASQQLQRWTNASDYEKGLSTVKLEVPKEKTKPSLTVARSIIADHTLPLEKITETIAKKQGSPEASEDARHLLLDMPSIVKNFMESTLKGDGLVDQYGDLVLKDNGTPYGSLADVLSELDLKKIGGEEEKAFNLYLLAKLDVERRPHNKAVLPQDINPQELIKFIESKYPKFKPTSEKLYDFYNKAVETWLVDTNIKDRSLFDALRKLYPSYVPLHSADEKTNRVSGKQRTDGNPANILERAFESDASKYNPVMGMVENVQKYIMRAKTVEALRAFDSQMKLIQENGWDVGGIADPAQKDLEKVDLSKGRNEAEKLAGKELAQLVQTGVVDDVAAQAVLDSIENVKDFTFVQKDTATGYDVINIPLEDGTISSWTIYDPQLLKALTMTGPNGKMNKIFRAAATLTRFLSANATSRNFKFSGQNVFSDEETSATTGKTGYNRLWKDIVSGTRPVHAAKTIASGVELLYNKIADTSLGRKFGMETSEAYKMFKRFGLLGNRYAFRDTKTQREVRRDLYGGKKTLGEALADLPKNIFKPIEIVTGFGEEMSRYGIFAHSGFDFSTYNGRLDAARASREGTTDFSKFGSGRDNPAYQFASSVISFLNAQIQGVNKTIDMVHEIKNDPKRRAVLLGRAVTNSLLAGAVTAIFRQLLWGEDEEEGYKDLTDYEKTKYVHLYKNPDGSWTKMKRSQDMLLQFADLLGEYIGEVSTGYEGDAWSDLVNGAWEVIKNGTISTDTSLQPIFDALAGKTWWGGDTDTYTERQMSMTARYGEDTSKFARLISTVSFGAVSPKAADYAIQQYLSSAGEMGTVAFDTIVDSMKDGRFNGQHLYKWFKEEVVGGYTIDPVMSNKIATTYYSDKERLEQIKTEAKDGKSPAFLRYNLSQDEMDAAVAEANKLLNKGGAVYEANSRYGALKKEYNKVLSPDSTLTMQQQDEKARKIKQEMNQALLDGNTAMGDFFRKYGYAGMFDQAFYNSMDIFTDSKKIPETQGTNSTNSLIPSDYGTQKESLIPANWGTGK